MVKTHHLPVKKIKPARNAAGEPIKGKYLIREAPTAVPRYVKRAGRANMSQSGSPTAWTGKLLKEHNGLKIDLAKIRPTAEQVQRGSMSPRGKRITRDDIGHELDSVSFAQRHGYGNKTPETQLLIELERQIVRHQIPEKEYLLVMNLIKEVKKGFRY